MKAKRARKKTFNAIVEKVKSNAIEDIKKQSSFGKYRAKVELKDPSISDENLRINKKVIKKLEKLGYKSGSLERPYGEHKTMINIFW